MTLRYQHRRISARARRRYRSIRDFLRRALGSSSYQKFNINSSIAVNVTELKHRVMSEKNHNRDCGKSCDGAVTKTIDKRDSVLSEPFAEQLHMGVVAEQKETSKINQTESEKEAFEAQQNQFTKLEHKILLNHRYKNTKMHKNRNEIQERPKNPTTNELDTKVVDNNFEISKYKTPCVYKNTAYYSTSSLSMSSFKIQNINTEYFNRKNQEKHCRHCENRQPFISPQDKSLNNNTKAHQSQIPNKGGKERSTTNKKNIQKKSNVDQDFITDIINRQYKPIKLFGRRESQISQFSAPICRDQEFCYRDEILEGTDICSCCHTSKFQKNKGLHNTNSVCDTQLHLRRHTNPRVHNRKYDIDIYNNAEEYDLIPVKETSTSKVWKKGIEYNENTHQYKEVLPSPRTQRPRLNLKAQYYTEINDYMVHVEHPKIKHPQKTKKMQICKELVSEQNIRTDNSSELLVCNKKYKGKRLRKEPIVLKKDTQIQEKISKSNNEEYSSLLYDLATFNLNKSPQTDKTEKALYEIKDLLQTFLKEIKKDPLPEICEKPDVTVKTAEQESELMPPTNGKNSLTGSSKNYNIDQNVVPPYIAPFPNCFYPVLQVPCPMNMQSNYITPYSSYTCQTCLNNPSNICNEMQCSKYKPTRPHIQSNINVIKTNETEQMIREIYKRLAQKPVATADEDYDFQKSLSKHSQIVPKNTLTSRSVGDVSETSHHDDKVETKKMKLYSKSCEALSAQSAENTETDQEHIYYSDTVSENLSLQLTDTRVDLSQSLTTVTEQITPVSIKKEKESKFSKVIKSFGLFKKKTRFLHIDNNRKSEAEDKLDLPFRQDTANYSPYGQDNLKRSLIPSSLTYQYISPRSYPSPGYSRRSGYEHGITRFPMRATSQDLYNPHSIHQQTIPEYQSVPQYSPVHFESPYSSYTSSFNPNPPQVPLCLKEIEVRNTAVQSDYKLSFLERISKKLKPQTITTTATTDTSSEQQGDSQQTDEGKKKWNWLGFSAKRLMNESPRAFSQKTRKELQEKDAKLRDAMIKKLLRRKNPFAPRNVFLQAFLGKSNPLKLNKRGLFSKKF